MEKIHVEKTASRGIAAAPVYKYQEPDLTPDSRDICEKQVPEEMLKFESAKEAVIGELQLLAEKSEIFAAHQEIAGDTAFHDGVVSKIQEERKNAQTALRDTVEEIAAVFNGMDDAYIKERAADIRDVGKRIMASLKGIKLPDLGNMESEAIIAARELYPSDMVKMNSALVKGILTEEGGVTSHVSIMAKSMNIPILVGVKESYQRLATEPRCV